MMRPTLSNVVVLGAGLFAWTACASGQSDEEAKPAAASKPAGPQLPFAGIPTGEDPLTVEEVEVLIERIEASWPPPADDPLRSPASLGDVLTILKLDQVNLFQKAVDFATRHDGLEASVLEAQIELAWGESYAILMEVLLALGQYVDRSTMHLQLKRRRTAAEETELEGLIALTDRTARVVEAFQLMMMDHNKKGKRLAGDVIAEHPDSYLGYRLAADYYRTVRAWPKFNEMIAKIEAIKPDSNGLVFLKAAAALQRDQDPQGAADLYREALDNDPQFVRAQAHLLMTHQEFAPMYAEFKKLRKLNPNHQVVQWVGGVFALAERLAKIER